MARMIKRYDIEMGNKVTVYFGMTGQIMGTGKVLKRIPLQDCDMLDVETDNGKITAWNGKGAMYNWTLAE